MNILTRLPYYLLFPHIFFFSPFENKLRIQYLLSLMPTQGDLKNQEVTTDLMSSSNLQPLRMPLSIDDILYGSCGVPFTLAVWS